MPQFLSDGWFQEVDKIRTEVGDLEVPEMVKSIVINIVVTGHPEGDKQLHMAAGDFKRGHADGAPTTMTLPYEVASGIGSVI